MTQTITAKRASNQLPQLMKRVNRDGARLIIRNEDDVPVVIVGMEDYIRTFGREPEILTRIGAQSMQQGTNTMSLAEINREIAASRRERRTTHAKASS